jgi:hypothetical protein
MFARTTEKPAHLGANDAEPGRRSTDGELSQTMYSYPHKRLMDAGSESQQA